MGMGKARGTARLRPAAALAGLLALAACAPALQTPIASAVPPLPDGFVGGSLPGEVESRWWTSFGDPQLDALVDRALANNPSIDAAAARLAQARALARQAGADRYPSLAARLDASESGVEGPAQGRDLAELAVDVSWEVDLWGRIGAQARGARTDALASEADLAALRQLVAAETARTYFAVIEAREQIALSTRVLETYDELIRQIGLRTQAGLVPQNYNALVIADRESAQAGLAFRQEDYTRLVRQLDVLLGDYPAGEGITADVLPDLPPLPATGLPAQLLARRPDVRSAALGVESAGYRVDAARAEFLPQLVLNGSTGGTAGGLAGLFDNGLGFWSVAGRLLQPVFEGGRLRARLDQRQGERDEAIARYGDTVLQALLEVETALAVTPDIAARHTAFARSAEAAEQAVTVSTLRYQAGIEAFDNVLESQQRALAARSATLSAARAKLDNRVALHLALAGDLPNNGPSPD
ncbi:MAG: efflux transporter outer membrane subunit [Erythrobacter sp.]|nr:efflux transporter outer membrane subunit [Erythrobacter sp.]